MIALGRFMFRFRNVLGPVLFIVALALSHPEYPFGREDLNSAFDVAGLIFLVSGELLRVVTIGYEYIIRGGRNRRPYAEHLVQGGVFAHVRNPLYVGNIFVALGLALVVHAWVFYVIVVPGILLIYTSIVASEEAYLLEKFGAEYEDYCRRVNRWVPRLAGFRRSIEGMRFNWKRVLVKEYGTFFIVSGAFVCVYLWSEYVLAGAAALPSPLTVAVGVSVWIALYLAVRALKKSGHIAG